MTDPKATVPKHLSAAFDALAPLEGERLRLQGLARADLDRREWLAAEEPTDPGEERTEP